MKGGAGQWICEQGALGTPTAPQGEAKGSLPVFSRRHSQDPGTAAVKGFSDQRIVCNPCLGPRVATSAL